MKRLRSSATRPPGTMPATLSFAPIHSVVTPTPAPTKLGMTSTWMPLACAAAVKQARRKNLPTTTAAAAAAPAHAAAAVEAGARLTDLLRTLLAGLARLVLAVEGLARFARQALVGSLARAGRARGLLLRPVAAALVHVGPAFALAAVLLPIAGVI